MEITIYKDIVENLFNEYTQDYEFEGNEYLVEEIYVEIASDFHRIDYPIKDLIDAEIEKMVTEYIIDFKRRYDVLNSVDAMVYDILEMQAEELKQKLFNNWKELPELESYKNEVNYLKHAANVKKILEAKKINDAPCRGRLII